MQAGALGIRAEQPCHGGIRGPGVLDGNTDGGLWTGAKHEAVIMRQLCLVIMLILSYNLYVNIFVLIIIVLV